MRIATTMLMFCVAALLALGMVMLYSASMTQKGAHYLMMQCTWCAIGLVAAVVMACSDYHKLRSWATYLFVVSVVLLMFVFVPPVGMKINGAYRWINLGFARFQPSELAKLTTIIMLSAYAVRHSRQMGSFKTGLLAPFSIVTLMMVLILLGRDYGTTILLVTVSTMVLLIGGVRWRHLLPVVLGVFGVIAAMMWSNQVRRARLLAWLDPGQHLDGTGYQGWQAILALGSGGIDGVGLGNSRQKLGFIPEHHTDFILSIVGEELGLVATLGIVLVFVVIVLCGFYIAWRARDPFGTYLAAGITFLIGLQAFINIGVVTAVLPNKGLPLPFISYGGSNLLIMLTSVGILISIARQGLEPELAPNNPFGGETVSIPSNA